MIHTYWVLAIAVLALLVRWQWHQHHNATEIPSLGQWWWTLIALALPPLWLLNSWTAVVLMGNSGTMWGHSVSIWGSVLSIAGLIWAGSQLAIAWSQGRQSLAAVQTLPTVEIEGQTARLLDQPLPYAAQVGFWRSQLVISQGLLDELTPEQIRAVLAHEAAHAHNRDTFVFFWLGWLHRLVKWLPRSQRLWQELLLLREMRADEQAAIATDPIDVAEALLLMAKFPIQPAAPLTTGMSDGGDRLDRRVQSLIQQTLTEPLQPASILLTPQRTLWSWGLMGLAACPLLIIALHH